MQNTIILHSVEHVIPSQTHHQPRSHIGPAQLVSEQSHLDGEIDDDDDDEEEGG